MVSLLTRLSPIVVLLTFSPVLRRLWPAIPLSSVYVELDKEAVIESGRLVVNASNIWWMDDCIGGAPWTEEYACSPSSSSSSSGSSEADSCLTPTRALTLWMVRMVNKTSDATVTSLEASNDTIELLNCEGLPATTGRLRIRAKFATTQESGSVSPIVLKAFDSDTLQFTTGIVAARVKSLSPYLVITGTDAGTGWKAGDLSFDFLDPNSQREGQPSLISLKNVREASYNDIMYFAFDAGIDSNIIGKIDIGQNTLSGDGTLILYFWVLARTAGTLPALTLTVANMRMPVDCTPVAFPTGTWDTVALPMCSGALTINQYVQVASAGIPVQPGDLLFFKLARSGTDVYAGELGVPSIRYVVAPTV